MTAKQVGSGLALITLLTLGSGCSDEKATTPSAAVPRAPRVEVPAGRPVELSPEELIEAGRVAYNANCIACHSLNPSADGALGPAVAGSSFALIEARVMRSEYPDGVEPKRTTRVMIPLPHLEPQLKALTAYLESLE